MDGCPFKVTDDNKEDENKFSENFYVLVNSAKSVFPNGAAMTAFTGWLSGIVVGKIGKMAVLSLGGGLLLLQVAHTKGYIKINEKRVEKLIDDVSKAKAKSEKKSFRDWLANSTNFALKFNCLTHAFGVGFLLGIWCS